ncbi:N-acetylmuramic acid 6-phosphate etherase [Kosakonia sp.]|uniref:N-acetylmuramic acid 6-phosphate etherase n=1 Tax=Kosakonia sp. TaxID=1916651 RepID=UPI0028A2AB73|nr:N-acetylmuramic acid 6-phosphate etherase [Kosakonia sp.]
MSSKPNGSTQDRRNPDTRHIDRLATGDMLALMNQQDRGVCEAIAACLPDITRLVDNASATANRGGRVVCIGAGASGLAAVRFASGFAQGATHPLVAIMAGGDQARNAEQNMAAGSEARGVSDLQGIRFTANDMLVALSVSGETPWICGAQRYAMSLGARVALVCRNRGSAAARLADIVLAPETGAEVISGFAEPKAELARQQILNMLGTGLAVRTGRVYSNLRVDIQPTDTHWAERQIAVVMAAAQCSREQAKQALSASDGEGRAAILMLLSGLSAGQAKLLLAENHHHLRIALREANVQAAAL